MHEQFQAEMERQERKLDNSIFQPPKVRTLSDIKRLLVDIDPHHGVTKSVPISSQMVTVDEQGNNVIYNVSANTIVESKRSILLNGFEAIKSRALLEERAKVDIQPIVVNGRPMVSAIKPSVNKQSWVDALLHRWLGATRDGMYICWKVQEGVFLYDLFEHKLFKKVDNNGEK